MGVERRLAHEAPTLTLHRSTTRLSSSKSRGGEEGGSQNMSCTRAGLQPSFAAVKQPFNQACSQLRQLLNLLSGNQTTGFAREIASYGKNGGLIADGTGFAISPLMSPCIRQGHGRAFTLS